MEGWFMAAACLRAVHTDGQMDAVEYVHMYDPYTFACYESRTSRECLWPVLIEVPPPTAGILLHLRTSSRHSHILPHYLTTLYHIRHTYHRYCWASPCEVRHGGRFLRGLLCARALRFPSSPIQTLSSRGPMMATCSHYHGHRRSRLCRPEA